VTEPIRNADPKRRRSENAAGSFFIDDECISCGACWALAPLLIESHPVHTFAFFGRQPFGPEEKKLAFATIQLCPVGAIGEEKP